MATSQLAGPDRYTGLPPGVVVGPLGQRFLAYLLDAVVPVVIVLLTVGLAGGRTGSSAAVVGYVLVVAWALVSWWMTATRAASPGMRLLKLQVVGFTDGRPLGWGRVLLRAVVFALLAVTGLGLLLMLLFLLRHPRHQGWHDRAANAVVIKARLLAPRTALAPAASPSAVSPPRPVPVAAAPERSVPRPAAPQPAPAVRWRAVLDDGREVPLAGRVLLGRNPSPRPGEEGAELVKVADDSRTVSKSHLAVEVDERGVFVVDLGSTNGSTVTTAGGQMTRCAPGDPVWVDDGAVVSMGDHWLTVRAVGSEGDQERHQPR